MDDRLDLRQPVLLPLLVGELHDEDAVLDRKPDQHDQADLTEDVPGLVEDPKGDDRTTPGKQDGDHDDEGIAEALELRGEDEVDEDQRQHEREQDVGAALGEIT